MRNHVHLLFRTGKAPVATVMRRLLTGYAISYNRRHRRHGQLFQNRYKSILCQEDAYLLELTRYIHLVVSRIFRTFLFGLTSSFSIVAVSLGPKSHFQISP